MRWEKRMRACIIFKAKVRKQPDILYKRVYPIRNYAEHYTGENECSAYREET